MHENVLNLPSNTSPAVHRSVLDNKYYEMDQNYGLALKDKQIGPDGPEKVIQQMVR